MTSQFRRGAADALRINDRPNDPPAITKRVRLYTKTIGGVSNVYAVTSDSVVSKLTPGATIAPTNGSRQTIVRRGGADVLDVLELAADPAPIAGQILAYGKNVAGVTQLFTRDSAGTIVQITPHLPQVAAFGAEGSDVRRSGADILAIIGYSTDPLGIAGASFLYGKLVNGTTQLFVRSNTNVVALLSEGPLDTTGVLPNQVYRVADNGVAGWDGNFPFPQSGQYWEYENGGAGVAGQGLGGWINSPAGAGAARAPLSGEQGWFQNGGSFSTGTTATGSNGTSRASAIVAGPASGELSYEYTCSPPLLSDNTDSFYLIAGWYSGSINPTLVVDGAYVWYTHSNNGGRFTFTTAKNSVRTSVDLGITVQANAYYHIRVLINNDGSASAWVKTTYTGGGWVDDNNWGAPLATIVTNIPSGTTNPFFGSFGILKFAGTNSRMIKVGFQLMSRIPPYTPSGDIIQGTGLPIGAPSTGIAVGGDGGPAWISPLRTEEPIQFFAYVRGCWIPSASADFGIEAGGTGNSGSATGVTADNNLWGMTSLNTGIATDGYSFYRTSYSLNIDSYVNPMIIETIMDVPTLSTAAQQFKDTFGIFNQVSVVLTRGITIELDTQVSANFQCVVTGPGGTTTVDSGIAAVAGTQYLCRVVISPGLVEFWIAQNGVTALTTPTASISTNIPTAITMAAGKGVRKIAGTTSRASRFGHILAESRSS